MFHQSVLKRFPFLSCYFLCFGYILFIYTAPRSSVVTTAYIFIQHLQPIAQCLCLLLHALPIVFLAELLFTPILLCTRGTLPS